MRAVDVARWISCSLWSLSFVSLCMLLSLRWHVMGPVGRSTRLAALPLLLGLVYGTWYSVNNPFPFNPAAFWIAGALALYVAVVGYWVLREIRTTAPRPPAAPIPLEPTAQVSIRGTEHIDEAGTA